MMIDDSPMPFGKYKGTPLRNMPDNYWRWFIEQEWAEYQPELLAYCEKKLGKKFNPIRKVRKCVLTCYGTVTGPDYDPTMNDGSVPFDV